MTAPPMTTLAGTNASRYSRVGVGVRRRPGVLPPPLVGPTRKDGRSGPSPCPGGTVSTVNTEISPAHRAEHDGVPVVNRAGLAELTGLSPARIMVLASPAERTDSGCPEPVGKWTPTGRTGAPEWWYPEDAARAWAASLRPASTPLPEPDDPDEQITAAQYRDEIACVKPNTWNFYVRRALPFWSRGEPGPELALPIDPSATGRARRWRRGAAVAHQNSRTGPNQGGRPAAADRVPQPTPEPDDPDELLSETALRTRIMNPPPSARYLATLIADSQDAWSRGEDGALPRPDDSTRHYTGRTVYRWRAGRSARWWNQLAAQAADAATNR